VYAHAVLGPAQPVLPSGTAVTVWVPLRISSSARVPAGRSLGEAANVLNSSRNDPRNPQLDTSDLNKFPVYVRFEQPGETSEWHLERADVTVNPGGSQIRYSALAGSPDIWLGRKSGRYCYLERV